MILRLRRLALVLVLPKRPVNVWSYDYYRLSEAAKELEPHLGRAGQSGGDQSEWRARGRCAADCPISTGLQFRAGGFLKGLLWEGGGRGEWSPVSRNTRCTKRHESLAPPQRPQWSSRASEPIKPSQPAL